VVRGAMHIAKLRRLWSNLGAYLQVIRQRSSQPLAR
jgi:hypothetical protein